MWSGVLVQISNNPSLVFRLHPTFILTHIALPPEALNERKCVYPKENMLGHMHYCS